MQKNWRSISVADVLTRLSLWTKGARHTATLPELPRELWVRIFFYAKLFEAIDRKEDALNSANLLVVREVSATFRELLFYRNSHCRPIFVLQVIDSRLFPNYHPYDTCEMLVDDRVYKFCICSIHDPHNARLNRLIYLVPNEELLHRFSLKTPETRADEAAYVANCLSLHRNIEEAFSHATIKMKRMAMDGMWCDCSARR